MPHAELADLAQGLCEAGELAGALEAPDGFELDMGSPTRPDQIRVICIRQPVRAGARLTYDRGFVKGKRSVARARQSKKVRNCLGPLCICQRVAGPFMDCQSHALGCCDFDEKLGTASASTADLKVGSTRTGDRPGAEKRTPYVGGSTAGAADHPSRWPLERSEVHGQDSGFVEYL